jgi:hypothetical protein
VFLLIFTDPVDKHMIYYGLFIVFSFVAKYFIPSTYLVKVAEDKTRTVLEALDSHGDSGCGVITLSLETGISQFSLRQVFKKHKKYCIPVVGESTFKLNRLTEEKGSIDKIMTSIEQEKMEARVLNALSLGLLFGLFLL